MGIIKSVGREITEGYLFEDLDITNWRGLRQSSEPRNLGIYFISGGFAEYFIPDITIAEIHELNYCNQTVEKSFDYICNRIVCDKCLGVGKFWWIDKAMSKDVKYNRLEFDYERNKYGDVLVVQHDFDEELPFYISTPHKIEGEEFCKQCYGTGFYFVSQELILKTIQLEHS